MVRSSLAALVLCLVLAAGCAAAPTRGDVTATPPAPAPVEAPPSEPPSAHARILAVGDLLMHTPLVFTSQTGDDQWDFQPLFAPVRPWLEGADLALADLETTLTGKDFPWSGYPSFNTPPDFARDVKAIGFDAVVNANNHALDYAEFGLQETADNLDGYGLAHTGTNRTPDEREKILVLNAGPSVKMALLSYTYGTNGVPLPQPWSVNMLDPERIRSDIRRARELPGVDLVGVALHFGQEYAREPDEEQERYVQLALEAGADIIFGDHVHVLQRIEVRQVKDESGRDARRAVIFSLGNFISNQEGRYREAGVMFVVDVKKEKGQTTVEQVSFVPTWVHTYRVNGEKRYRVVVVEKAITDYEAGADPLITAADYARLKEVWADTTAHMVGSPEVAVLRADRPVTLAGIK